VSLLTVFAPSLQTDHSSSVRADSGHGAEFCFSHFAAEALTLRLRAILGGFYRISLDGKRVSRGDKPYGAEELQPGFVDAMIRAGEL
jgi:hypothetical protein